MNLFVLDRMANRQRNERGRWLAKPMLDVREETQVPELERLILNGPVTFVLIHADWCGHCHKYMPKFKDIAKTPGRTAQMAAVHHDIVDKIPAIANAKITGYPSVVKVTPEGQVEDYKVPGSPETTNVVPEMNDPKVMKQLVKAVQTAQPNAKIPGPQGNLTSNVHFLQKNAEVSKNTQAGGAYGSVLGAFMSALNKAAPASLLLLANSMLPKRGKTYKSPKKSNRRASTRRNRNSRR